MLLSNTTTEALVALPMSCGVTYPDLNEASKCLSHNTNHNSLILNWLIISEKQKQPSIGHDQCLS